MSSPTNIFTDSYPNNFFSIRNKYNFGILEKLLGDDKSRVQCLAPDCNSNYRQLEKRKALWVELLINALSSGISLDSIPVGCSCEELACACEGIILTGEPVETAKAELTLVTTGESDDIAVLSDNSDIDLTVLAADNPGTNVLGDTSALSFLFTLPDTDNTFDTPPTLSGLTIGGEDVDASALPDLLWDKPSVDVLRVFAPSVAGITAMEFTLNVSVNV